MRGACDVSRFSKGPEGVLDWPLSPVSKIWGVSPFRFAGAKVVTNPNPPLNGTKQYQSLPGRTVHPHELGLGKISKPGHRFEGPEISLSGLVPVEVNLAKSGCG